MGFFNLSMDTPKQFALVIGNSEYSQEENCLESPKYDAKDKTAALQSVNFDVIH